MTALCAVLRAALDASDGDELAAIALILRRCREPLFRRALIAELTPELEAQSPALRQLIDEAETLAAGDTERVETILRERHDPRENPTTAARVGREARYALIRVLLAAIRDENTRVGWRRPSKKTP